MAKAKAMAKQTTPGRTAPRGAKKAVKESPIERGEREAAVEAEAELRSLLAAIREHEREIAARFYDLGLALKRIVDRKLYGVRNHASLEALLKAEGLLAIAVQHEYDHLDGTLMVDRVSLLKRRMIDRDMKKRALQDARP